MKKLFASLLLTGIFSFSAIAQSEKEVTVAVDTIKEVVSKKVAKETITKAAAVKETVTKEEPTKAVPVKTAAKKEKNLWRTLAKITFKKEYDELMGFKIDVPVFSEAIEALAGKEVTIKGYIIPVEGYKGHKEFILSAFPYNMCFFCGGAGPETVMEVVAKEEIEYSAEAVTIKGKLELNDADINRLMFALSDAVLVEE